MLLKTDQNTQEHWLPLITSSAQLWCVLALLLEWKQRWALTSLVPRTHHIKPHQPASFSFSQLHKTPFHPLQIHTLFLSLSPHPCLNTLFLSFFLSPFHFSFYTQTTEYTSLEGSLKKSHNLLSSFTHPKLIQNPFDFLFRINFE